MVYVNGRISRGEDAVVPVFDHGFLYGEGVYETLRTYDRVPFLFDRHMRRLRRSAGLIALGKSTSLQREHCIGFSVHSSLPGTGGRR